MGTESVDAFAHTVPAVVVAPCAVTVSVATRSAIGVKPFVGSNVIAAALATVLSGIKAVLELVHVYVVPVIAVPKLTVAVVPGAWQKSVIAFAISVGTVGVGLTVTVYDVAAVAVVAHVRPFCAGSYSALRLNVLV